MKKNDYDKGDPLAFFVKDMNDGKYWYKKFCNHSRKVSRDYNDCEDIIGEFLLNIIENKRKDDKRLNDLRVLYGCLNRKEVDFLRYKSRRREKEICFSDLNSDLFKKNYKDYRFQTPEDELFEAEKTEILADELLKLKDIHQKVIRLFYWERLEYKKIARILNLPIRTVETVIYVTKKRLKKSKKLQELVSAKL